ncbi:MULTISPECIES: DUF262 domain-containing protein [unclassified Variovorax]|uniref:DUF262 domain-containing protein n=1 Tax=unclassified Variovorax TaxID=663243 RepID=UPI00076D3A5A|nr:MULTISPECIES: DUF262 domain-containing protein [unclassified Variovorax]KWT98010.1 Phage protein [Variovorax sp. WDL1]PNG50521.1 hypothetical protein CHC06_06145 [Variovorax sp. B2]PNG51394.1 hypothetical protein CHC07_06051 [Variovorax sp. B4]VTU42978.1 hypothetical protein H6P1_00327 [Variovorax sp. PBL-H6]VTU43542.1 hypothetical protein SRS16P1_00578 [Variovorax sp. SRS16]
MSAKPFHRYDGHDLPGVDPARKMPRATINASTSPRSIGELVGRLELFTSKEAEQRQLYPWASRFVLGYPLPDWQRALVWSGEQKARFITSLWLDIDVGTYLVNDMADYIEEPGKPLFARKFTDVLLDGQQRLSALEDYLLNKLAVPDVNGQPCRWEELGKVERRLFCNKTFGCSFVRSWDEATLRQIYDLRSFGGTPHLESERASASPEHEV